jgi:pimeloyl-ACP methyl ester carboxylesterase
LPGVANPNHVQTFLKLVLFATAIYALLCLALYVFQARLIYFPMKALAASPAAIGLGYQDVNLEAPDGSNLHGWFVPGRDGARTLLFLHGNAGNISHRLDSLRLFSSLGLNIFIIDYRGFGRSGGSPGEQETYEDARVAWRHLTGTRGIDPSQVVVFGRSLGGGVATWLASEETPGGLILESSFGSVPELAAKFYPLFPVRWLARVRYDNRARLPKVRCPVLIAHSRDDEIVPFTQGRALFELAPEPKYFLEMRGSHNVGFLTTGRDYVAGLAAFLAVLDGHQGARATTLAGIGEGAPPERSP